MQSEDRRLIKQILRHPNHQFIENEKMITDLKKENNEWFDSTDEEMKHLETRIDEHQQLEAN